MKLKYKIGLTITMVLSLFFIIIFTLKDKPTGCISGDCLNGFGTMKFSNGNTYTGTWKNGFMYGYGKQVMGPGKFEGDTFKGFFVHGDYNGKGIYFFSKYDSKLIGQWKDGKPDGLCTVYFGAKSLWSGSYRGTWINGENIEFQNFLKTTKNSEVFIANAAVFYDTLNYYYKSVNLQSIIDEIVKIHQSDLTKDKIPPNQIIELVKSINDIQTELNYSIEMMKTFNEYDSTLPYKNTIINYLNCFKTGFDNELSRWILAIQHNASNDKPDNIYEILEPFVRRTNYYANKWEKMKLDFKDKYKIIRTNNNQ